MAKAQLVIATGELAGKVIYLAEGQKLTVGRAFTNDLSINDPGASREHATFDFTRALLAVRDLKSRNGILVNRQKVPAAFLLAGDEVTVGTTVFKVGAEVTEVAVIGAPPTDMPLEGLANSGSTGGTEFGVAGATDDGAAPDLFHGAHAEELPQELGAMAAEFQFLETHPNCTQCGGVVGKREIAAGKARRESTGFLCSECASADLGRTIGAYQLTALISAGQTGKIFRAEHTTIRKVVAIKILRGQVAGQEEAKLRFLREARTGAALNHPNIVQMFDAGEQQGTFYLVMELVDGRNLDRVLLEDGPLPPGRALQVAIQVARALDYAHGKGIVHRDVRPHNILLAAEDRVKLIDIGTAQWMDAAVGGAGTQPGAVYGDFDFLAPEQLRPEPKADPLADLYALGATLYALLTGHPPFHANTAADALRKAEKRTIPAPSFSNPKVPDALDQLILRLLNLEPAQRCDSAASLVEELSDLYGRLFDDSFLRKSLDEPAPTAAKTEEQEDLRMARDIQSKLVPARIPELPGWDLAKIYKPAKNVGGDYLDFFPVDKNRHAVIIADVSGKGISGAMVMVMVRQVFRMVALLGKSPAETIIHANKSLAKDFKKGMFVSLIYGVLDTDRRVLHYANAGHNHPVYFNARRRDVRMLRSGGMVLGINSSQVFENSLDEFAVRFEAGDRLVLYTDGVNEAKDEAGADFGNAAMLDVIQTASEGGAASSHVVRTLIEAVGAHRAGARQSDDITVFALSLGGA